MKTNPTTMSSAFNRDCQDYRRRKPSRLGSGRTRAHKEMSMAEAEQQEWVAATQMRLRISNLRYEAEIAISLWENSLRGVEAAKRETKELYARTFRTRRRCDHLQIEPFTSDLKEEIAAELRRVSRELTTAYHNVLTCWWDAKTAALILEEESHFYRALFPPVLQEMVEAFFPPSGTT